MQTQSVLHNTFVLERSYPFPANRVFAAFANPAQKRRWFLESRSNEIESFEMDFREGGQERARMRLLSGPIQGSVLINQGIYLDIVPDKRIVMVSTLAVGEQRISTSLVTFELLPVENATNLMLTHQAAFFEGADGPAIREVGWRTLLDKLTAELLSQSGSNA